MSAREMGLRFSSSKGSPYVPAQKPCGGLTLFKCQVPAKATLSLSSSAEENILKGSWVKTETERDHSPIAIMGKTYLTRGNYFNLLSVKSEEDDEK